MKLTNKYQRVPLDSIVIHREERQRRKIDPGPLVDSIRRYGVMNPIIVTRELVLIAGERRCAASREAGYLDIPVRFIDELSHLEAQLIELEENVRRSDLDWRDMVKAVARIHQLHLTQDPTWTQKATAESVGLVPGAIAMQLRVARDLDSEKLAGANSYAAAYNILSRTDARAAGDAISGLIEAGAAIFQQGPAAGGTDSRQQQEATGGEAPIPLPIAPPPPDSLLQANFLEWVKSYSGPPFTFLHCDFPYGIGLESIQMHERTQKLGYGDEPEIYWNLLDCLCTNLDRLMAYSSHLMFWFSMTHYQATLEFFQERAPSLEVNPFPLVWLKSDGAGILPDQRRGPRRIYETAFLASRGDRPVLVPVFNAYAGPTDKAHHPSAKPEPVLRHFFRMFVDETTTLLDPTCGGGSALRAAESLGARQVLGLELDSDHFAAARSALRAFRVLRRASAGV